MYEKLTEMENLKDEYMIKKDVTRTFTNYPMVASEEKKDDSWNTKAGEEMLFHILLAYANYDTQTGYCQGLNYISAMLLMYIQDEESVFWCLIYLMNRKNWRLIYIDEMPKLMEIMDKLERKLETDYPEVNKHLNDSDFTASAAFSPLFITLYIYQIDHTYAMRIFETFLLDGETALLRVLYRMLDMKGYKICKLIEMDLIMYLRTDIINECIEENGIASLLA